MKEQGWFVTLGRRTMNKIYKSIWNHVTRTFTAVSEAQKSKGKRSRNALLSSVCISVMAALPATSHAYKDGENIPVPDGVSIGTGDAFVKESETNFYGKSEFLIPSELDKTTLSSEVLMNLSNSVYEQTLLYTDELSTVWGLQNNEVSVSQGVVTQKQGDSAILTFAIGDEAFRIIQNNKDSYESKVEEISDNSIRIDGIEGGKSYDYNGIAYHYPAWSSASDRHYVWTLALLKQAELIDGKTLVLSINEGENTWAAKTIGSGNLEFNGDGTLNIASMIFNNFDANDSSITDENTYSGETHIVGDGGRLTVNLSKKNSFGETSFLNAENANINVQNSEAWTSVKNLSLNSVQTDFSSSGTNRFTVQNSGQTAVFKGNNEFVLPENFFYVVNGNAEIADGTTTFSGTDSTVQIDGTLTLHSAESLVLTDGTLKIGTSLDFAGVEESSGAYTQKTDSADEDGYIVNLTNSTIQYVDGSSLTNVSQTTLNENSSLTLSASNQSYLGGTVVFGEDERSQLTINSTGELNLTAISLAGTDGLTILHAGAPGEKAQTVTLADGVDLSQYGGWLRIESGALSLDKSVASKFTSAGLSVGEGGVVRVTGNETLSLNRFGWAVVDGEGHRDGALDLREFDFTDQNKAALIIENIQLDSKGDNFVIVDTDEVFKGLTTDMQSGSVFALDDGNVGQLLIHTTLTQDESSGGVTLVDEKYQEITSDSKKEQNFYSSNDLDSQTLAAVGHWDVRAGYRAKDQAAGVNQDGIYVQYVLSDLTLVNGGANSSQPLNSKAALVAVSDGSSRRLTTKIAGYGVLEVENGNKSAEDRFVEINNTENSYTGATVVRGNTELRFVQGALGDSSVVLSGENADLMFQSSTSEGQTTASTQTINGLHTDDQAHRITLNEKTTLRVVGNGEQWADNFYLDQGNSGNVLGANTVLSGTGSLVLENGVEINVDSAAAFNGFKGTIAQEGSSMIQVDGLETLNAGKYLGEQASTIVLKTSAQIGKSNADFSDYHGTLKLNGQDAVYTIAGEVVTDALSKDATLDAQNVSVTLNGVEGGFDNAVTGSGSVLRLENSSVKLDATTGDKGFASVQIDENSALLLTNGDSGGALERFDKDTTFGGSGKLALSNYVLTDKDINLSELSGTLALQKESTFTLNDSAGYAVELSGESTLAVSGTDAALAVSQSGGTRAYKDLTVQGQGTLDLTQAGQHDGALFTVNQVVASGENSLTVKVSDDQTKTDAESKNILKQDEGWDRLLVESVAENADAAQVTIVDQNGKNVAAEAAEIALAEGVTGTYAIGSSGQNGDIGLTYRLDKLNIEQDASFVLDAEGAGNTDARDLGVVLTGSGTLEIAGNVIVDYQQDSAYSGTYDLENSAQLTLKGKNDAVAAVSDVEAGSTLILQNNQSLALNTFAAGSSLRLEGGDPNSGVVLTLVGDNNKFSASGSEQNAATLSSSTNDRLVLEDSRLIFESAADNLANFQGTLSLKAVSTLVLKNGNKTDAFALNFIGTDIDSTSKAAVNLSDGSYVWGSKHQAFAASWQVEGSASLTLSGWEGSETDLTTGTTAINGSGILVVSDGSVSANASSLSQFTGTLNVNADGAIKISLQKGEQEFLDDNVVVNGADKTAIFEIANNSGVEATFDNRVSGGVFKVSAGEVTFNEGTTVSVAETDVVSGASLKVYRLDQLGDSVMIDETSTVRVNADAGLDFADKSISGKGTLLVDLGGQNHNLTFAENTGASGNEISIRLTNASHAYDSTDGFARYLVGGNGRFAVSGTETVELAETGWSYKSEDVHDDGIIDLSRFEFANEDVAAIETNALALSANGNYVQVDLSKLSVNESVQSGNILSLDNGNLSQILIAGKSKNGVQTITLLDKDGQKVESTTELELSHLGGNKTAALSKWSTGAVYQDTSGSEGIYLNYGITSLTLLNGGTNSQVLDAEASMVAVGYENQDRDLTADVDGYGILEFRFEEGKKGVIELLNDQNDYTGATVVRDSTTLNASSHALGYSTLMLVGTDAGFVLKKSEGAWDLYGLNTDDASHVVSIGEGLTLTLSGNGLGEADAESLSKGYGTALTAGNHLGQNTVLQGAGNLEIKSTTLTAASAATFNAFEGSVALTESDAKLTINSANEKDCLSKGKLTGVGSIALNVNTNIGASDSQGTPSGVDLSEFTGLIQTAGYSYVVHDLESLGKAEIQTQGSKLIFNGVEGSFANVVSGNGSSWNLVDSSVELTGSEGKKTGIDVINIDDKSSLILRSESGTLSGIDKGGLGVFGIENAIAAPDFKGQGRLSLAGYRLSSDEIRLTDFEGTLGLLDKTEYTLKGSAGYGVSMADSTLAVAQVDSSVQQVLYSGESVLDLTSVPGSGSDALLTFSSLGAASQGASLTVRVSNDQVVQAIRNANVGLLDQDDGDGAKWLIASGNAQGASGVKLTVSQTNKVELKQGVTATYSLASQTDNKGISLQHLLKKLEVSSEYELKNETTAQKDLKTVLVGSGRLNVAGNVEIAYQTDKDLGESSFNGTYSLKEGSLLTLSGVNSKDAVASVNFGKDSQLTVLDEQRLKLGTVGSGSAVVLGGVDKRGALLLEGVDNHFETGAALRADSDSALGLSADAQLRIDDASNVLKDFQGDIVLLDENLSSAKLTLAGGDKLGVDNIRSNDESQAEVVLEGGDYVLSGSATNFHGSWNVEQNAQLLLEGWTTDRTDFVESSQLEGFGTVALGSSTVALGADNVSGFRGTFDLGSVSTLTVYGSESLGLLNSVAKVISSENGTLELVGLADQTLDFGSTVNMQSGTFKVSGGHVTIGTDASIDVAATEVTEGAQLDAAYAQIGTNSVKVNGLLNVAATADENKQFEFTQTISGEGTLNVDLGSTDNKLVFADGQNSATTVMVSNGTHVYDAKDGFTNYAVGEGGVFAVDSIAGSSEAPLGSFRWEGGELDLSGITYTGEPALTVGNLNALAGTLKLDLEKWVRDLEQSVDTKSNLLDADEGVEGNDILVVKGEVNGVCNVKPVDKNGEAVKADATTTEVDGGLALAHWGYELVKKNSESDKGLALTYALTKLELTNSGADKDAVVLRPDEGGDNRFTAEIAGSGKLEIQGDVELAHSSNTFTGQVAVTDKSTLTTQGSNVLGQGEVTLILGSETGGANYIMAQSQATDGSVYSETITLVSKGESGVMLNGNRLEMLDGSSISAETAFSAGTDQKKTSSLIVAGDVTLESAASTLNATDAKDNLDGLTLEIVQDGNLIAEGADFTLERVTGQGTVTLALDESAAATAGDLSGFGGTVSVGQSQNLVLAKDSQVDGVTVALNEGKLSVKAAQSVGALTTTAGSQIDFGSMSVGAEAADGMLTIKGSGEGIADATKLSLDIDANVTDHQSVLSLDDGVTTKLLAAEDGGLGGKSFVLSAQGLENGAMTGVLKDGDTQIGTLHFAVAQETTDTEVGVKSTLESIGLTGELKLAANGSDLKARIDGKTKSAVTVDGSETLTLAGANTYGALNVAASAAVDLKGVQTIVGTGGVVAGSLIDGSAQSLILGEGANLTFTAVQNGLKHGVGLKNGSQLILSGINAAGDSLLAGPLTLLSGEASLAVENSKGMLDLDQIQAKAGDKFLVAAENSALALKDGQVDLKDKIGVSLKNSSLAMTSSEQTLAVDWSNLSGDDGSVVSITSSVGQKSLDKAQLSFVNVADGFQGTVEIRNYAFAFGGENTGNNALLANHNTSFAASDLHANGKSTVGNLKLDNGSTLSFHESERIDLGDSSTSLITVAEGGNLNLGGANVRIDTDNLNFEFKDSQSGTTSESLLTALNKAQADDVKYFKLVEGKVENVGSLTDLNGQDLSESSSVGVLDDNGRTVAELGFGANLQIGEGGEDLWVGQGLRTLKLHKSTTLNAALAEGLKLTDDSVFNINAVVTSAAEDIDLTIAGETPIQLNGANGWISGSTNVTEDGHLILGASYALGGSSDGSKPTTGAINVAGTLTLKDNVAQSTQKLAVAEEGVLELGSSAQVEVIGSETVIEGTVKGQADSSIVFKEDAVVKVEEGADLNGMKGQWDLTSGAVMKIAAGEQGQSLTSGSILGGTLVKTGEGELELGFNVVNNNVAIESQGGSLNVVDWNDKLLSVKSMTLKDTEFALAGNLKTSEGFAAESSKIWIGSRDHQAGEAFADRVIEGDFAADNATLVFNTALGTEASDGDSLTITGDAKGKATLLVHNTTDVKTDYQDLTILSVNGSVEGFEATANFDAEGYTYRLGTTTGDSGTDYFLTSKADGGDSGSDAESMISARLGSLTGFASSFDMFAMSLHDRQGTRPWINPVTGEKTTTSLWMRQTASLENTKESRGQLDSRNNEYVTMIGGDILQHLASDDGYVFAGLMAGYGTSDVRTASSLSGNKGRTDTDGWMVGAYGGWHQNNPNTDRTGLYAAGWVQYSHFKADITQSGDPMSVSAQGLSASLEAGWVAKAADFLMDDGVTHGALYIEPHAQVTWSGVGSENLSDRNMDIYGKHNITTRLGARVTLETNGATNFSPYLEANWVYNTKDYGARWGEVESYQEGAGSQAEVKLGAETFFTDAFSGYAQLRLNWGGDGYSRKEGSLGLKYRF